jgi:Type IV secretion system pilin
MNTNIYTKILPLIIVVAVLCIGAHVTFAGDAYVQVESSYTPLAPLPNLTSQTLELAKEVTFSDYAQYVFNLLVALGAVAAVFMITWGGFEYMTSDVAGTKTGGLDKVKNAVYGLIIILASVLIVRTINPQFGNVPAGLVPPARLGYQQNANSLLLQALNNAVLDQTETANRHAAVTDAQVLTLINNLNKQLAEAGDAEAKACDQKSPTYSAQGCAVVANTREIVQDALAQAEVKQIVTAYTAKNASDIERNTANFLSPDKSPNDAAIYLEEARRISNEKYQSALRLAGNNPEEAQNLKHINNTTSAIFAIEDAIVSVQKRTMTGYRAINAISDYQKVEENKLKNTQNPSTSYIDAVSVVGSFATASIELIKHPPEKIIRPDTTPVNTNPKLPKPSEKF